MAPSDQPIDYPELFEGPEKTLTLRFKSRRIATKSLRLIPQDVWAKVLEKAKCEIISSVESNPVELQHKSSQKDKAVSTRGVTGYLLSESSLFVTDNTLTLKTCGTTTPLAALEPLLDLAVPSWRQREPKEYLKYATFMRLGYMRPNEQLKPHTSWSQEVEHMNSIFKGEAVVLGSSETSTQHVYVANYMPKGEIVDVFSTQVALTDLDTSESMKRYAGGEDCIAMDNTPLQTAWKELHGEENRFAANAALDEKFFDPIGYSANAVFGKHFTTVHVTPQPGCSYLSVETSMPLTRDACRGFVAGASDMCKADTLAVTEFCLCPKLFSAGSAPDLPSYTLHQSSHTVSTGFACAHYMYKRSEAVPPSPYTCPSSAPTSIPGSPVILAETSSEDDEAAMLDVLPPPSLAVLDAPVVEVDNIEKAPAVAAELFLGSCDAPLQDDVPVALLDTAVLKRKAELWHKLLPRVEPFYAVKCNSHPAVVASLWSIWAEYGVGGFDCASPAEMQLVLNLGVDPAKHIVYANPCKQVSAVTFAKEAGVNRLIFDNEAELDKLASIYPSAELVLRVQTDDSLAQCPLSNKFGAAPADCDRLLGRAKELGMKVVGVSFHVGSGCSQPGAFRGALHRARAAFDEAELHGFQMKLLDIGGGFQGWDEAGQASFANHAADICETLEELFPSPDIQVIAEPGRFFVATAQAMLTTVVSVAESSKGCRYYLNDGLYGSFNCVLYDHASVPRPSILRHGRSLDDEAITEAPICPCTIFGPTCDGFDMITDSMPMPQLQAQDRLLFPNMGAYTSSASTSFNGFAPASVFVYQSQITQLKK